MKTLLLGALLISVPTLSKNQTINTLAHTNTAGIYSVLVNPANAAASKDWISINAIGLGLGMENNIIHTRLDYSALQIFLIKHRMDNKPYYTKPFFEVAENAPAQPAFFANVQVLLPSIKINLSPKISLFGYWQERVVGNAIEVGSSILPLVVSNQLPTNYSSKAFSADVRALCYREAAIGFGAVLYNKRENFIKVGFTFKQLTARFAYIINTQYFTSTPTNTTVEIASRYRVLSTDLQKLVATPTDFALGTKPTGTGVAASAGFVYEHRPNHLKHRYRTTNPKGKNKNFRQRGLVLYDFKMGVCLTDWGYIDLKSTNVTDKVYELKTTIDLQKQPAAKDFIKDYTKNAEVVEHNKSTRIYTPAQLQLAFDYRINHSWFANFAYAQNLRNSKSPNNFYSPTNALIMLRKETDKITYGFPLRVVPKTRTATVGSFLALGPFFIGTDNVMTFLSRKLYNLSLYTGFCYTLNYKKDPTIETFKNFGQY